MEKFKKYNCDVDKGDYMEVDSITDDSMVFFEIISEREYGEISVCVGLSKEKVKELIEDLQNS